MGNELQQRGSLSLNNYKRVITENDFLKYLVYIPQSGNSQVVGNPLKTQSYADGDYVRSSKAVAYFELHLKDGTNSYYDVCNPIYKSNNWNGVIRMGFETFYE